MPKQTQTKGQKAKTTKSSKVNNKVDDDVSTAEQSWAKTMETETGPSLDATTSALEEIIDEMDDVGVVATTTTKDFVKPSGLYFSYPEGSVANFNEKEIESFASKSVGELSNTQLLQVLMYRGRKELNPFLTEQCATVLRKMHNEFVPKKFGSSKFPSSFKSQSRGSTETGTETFSGEKSKSKFPGKNTRPYKYNKE